MGCHRVFAFLSVWALLSVGADTKANTLRVAAHSRSEIIVSLRMAASAEAPSTPMLLPQRLRVRGGARMVREVESSRVKGR